MNPAKRWRALPRADRRALWPAAWRLVWVRVTMAMLGLARARKLLGRGARPRDGIASEPEYWQARARALQRVGRRLPATRCLARSLALWWWMRGEGLDPELHVGVRRDTGEDLQGHAWVECDGILFDETPAGVVRWQRLAWKASDDAAKPENCGD